MFQYRRRVPIDLLAVFDRNEVWRTLDTDSYLIALRRIHRVAACVETEFEQAREALGRTVDPTLIKPSVDNFCVSRRPHPADRPSGTVVTTPQIAGPTISEIYDSYIEDPRRSWTKRTAIAHATTRRWIVETFGAETPIAAVTREGCREFVDLLRQMPAHADKRFPNLPIREVVAAAKARGEGRMINTANLNAYINRFGGLLNWAVDEGYIERNPAKGLKLRDPVKRRDKRSPFSIQQLRDIFNAPIYTGCEDDERGYAISGFQRPRRARFWVPLIALFSGLRLNEICQLEVTDIQEIDGIPCFRVASGISDAGNQKRVKTTASERIVPVHDDLIRFGFLAFIQSQRLRHQGSLFPELPLGHLGYRSTSVSKWFSRFLVSAKADAALTCFHSFRHNFRDGLREAKVDRDVSLVLGGWTTDGKGSAVADNYGSGYSASLLADALNSVYYRKLDLSHLYVVSNKQ